MSKLRSVSTAFWSDPFVEDLTPTEKLLFLYLVTNEKTNMLGIYEASISKMSFETGIDKKTLSKALERFEQLKKVKYINNFVILVNFLKHQNFNTNMKKSAIDVYNDLPKELKDSNLTIHKGNPSEGFESLCNHYGMVRKVEVEVEVEVEREVEVKVKKNKKEEIPAYSIFEAYALEKKPTVDVAHLKLKYESWIENQWVDGHGNPIQRWKSKVLATLPFINEKVGSKQAEVSDDEKAYAELQGCEAIGWKYTTFGGVRKTRNW